MACASPISVDGPAGPVQTRCRQCLPCRIHHQSALTFRCLLENQTASSGYFLTLTYEKAPEVGSYRDFSLFMKRLRKRTRRLDKTPIRYLAIGEYGDTFGRFHYHALIWNALPLESEDLRGELWPLGFSHIGEITPASVRYTVRYTLKFMAKGEEDLPRGRSKRPPLGEPSMMLAGSDARTRGLRFEEPPDTITWAGRSFPVDNAMKIAWMEGYNPEGIERDASGTRKLARSSALDAHTAYVMTRKFGDPFGHLRERAQERAFGKMLRRHHATL